MKQTQRLMCVVAAMALAVSTAAAEEAAPDAELSGRIRAEFLGQDGHDYVQKSPGPGANDIQDLHVRVTGLPADEEIATATFTRQGGGQWGWELPWGPWEAHLVREAGSETADFFMEPSHDEESFGVDARIVFKSGRVAAFSFAAGKSNSSLLMPNVGLKPVWIGQDGQDRTGTSESVGPDGFEDVRIEVSGLGTRSEIRNLTITSDTGRGWEYGRNPQRDMNAELIFAGEDKSRGTLHLSPDRDLAGETLTLTVNYANDMTDSATLEAKATDRAKAMPRAEAVELEWVELAAQWLGQDGADLTGRGDVHVTIGGLPDAEVDVVALSNTGGGYWVWPLPEAGRHPMETEESAVGSQQSAEGAAGEAPQTADSGLQTNFYVPQADEETYATLPIEVKRDGEKLHLYFQPFRDERGGRMTWRVRLSDGRVLAGQFEGGECDPFMRGELPADTSITARPGDDLHKLVNGYGTVTLTAGEYELDRPLEIERPVTITGPREAIVRFVQKDGAEPWTYAVLVKASNVTLEGFSLRAMKDLKFSDHWMDSSSFIKAPNRGFGGGLKRGDLVANLVIRDMDIDVGERSSGADAENPPFALDVLHSESATSGKVTGTRWRGGTLDVNYGPWIIADNVYLGAPEHTQSPAAFGAHWSHDIRVEHNRFDLQVPHGKQWRVYSMNQFGDRVFVRDNHVPHVGMQDGDTVRNPNMPEILITESYRLYFEGRPSGITNGGRVVHVPYVQYGRARPGTVVSVLNGPHAGTWARVAQPITGTTWLMDQPLPEGEYDIHVAHGFTDSAFERNYIDNRNGRSVVVLLAGNHWNFRVADNHLLGGGASILVDCCPTEQPSIWGYSHTVMFDVVCEGNLHEDSLAGTEIDVHSDKWAKTATGRTYLVGAYRNNVFKWTAEAIEAMRGPRKVDVPPKALRVGRRSFDVPGQMRMTVEDNYIDLPAGVEPGQNYELRHGTINGEVIHEKLGSLPAVEEKQTESAGVGR